MTTTGVHAGSLVLVNAAHACCASIRAEDLVPVGDGSRQVLLDRRAAVLLARLMEDIRGWTGITVVSGWRPLAQQQKIWEDSLRDNGEAFTRSYVAVPGHSEHQTGLAIDLAQKKEPIDFIRPAFPDDGLCRLFRKQAARYGFIQRYPAGKEAVTGIACEPWHFRYVGIPHAAIMAERGLTLEEYLLFLRQYPHGVRPFIYETECRRFAVSFLSKEQGADCASEHVPRLISGNNMDGYIVTQWEEEHNGSAFS